MIKRIISFVLFFILIINIGFCYTFSENILHKDHFSQIFDIYKTKSNVNKEIKLNYEVDIFGKILTQEVLYKDIIIGDIILTPNIINSTDSIFDTTAKSNSIYLLSIDNSTKFNECISTLQKYYQKLPFNSPFNIYDKDIIINKFMLPLTKEKIISHLVSNNVGGAENCFYNLLKTKNLIEYPILLEVTSKIKEPKVDLTKNYSFTVDFIPQFNNSVKPIKFNINFKKEPLSFKSEHTAPKGCEYKEQDNCYVNYSLVQQFNDKFIDQDNIPINNLLKHKLTNLKIIENFKDLSFENLSVIDIIIDSLPRREQLCFKEDNGVYNKTIFDTAKAYNLTLEQTFQLWAIIAERSNCNSIDYKTPNFLGYSQINIDKRKDGTLFTLDSKLPQQFEEEEQYQYLALGDFSEINETMLNNIYNKNKNKFYKIGYNGKINNDNTYFGFLINAINKNGNDGYGSTVLFTSDYIKEINFLVKNTREKSNRSYDFLDFIKENDKSVDYAYLLGYLINANKENKEKIYTFGNFDNLFSNDINLFVKATTKQNNITHTYIKTTKDARILINYLAIKRKYFKDPDYFYKLGLETVIFSDSRITFIVSSYEKLNHKYWDTKKELYLTTLEKNNINLVLKKPIYHNVATLLKNVPGKSGYCARYVYNLGLEIYENGKNIYQPNMSAWHYDTHKNSIENYNLIWEAKGICDGKTKCKTVPTSNECCNATLEVQDDNKFFPIDDLVYLVDGSIIGLYIPGSKYNSSSIEYTHVGMYIGKTNYGEYLMAHAGNNGQSISIIRNYLKNNIKILRVYVPKSTGITHINQLKNLNNLLPSSYVTNASNYLPKINASDIDLLAELVNYEFDDFENNTDDTDVFENNFN